jgi:hypothetical protein
VHDGLAAVVTCAGHASTDGTTHLVTGAEAPREDGEVWPPGFESAKHMAGTSTSTQDSHPDGQATPNPSMPINDSQPNSDATPTLHEAARRLARFTEEVQAKVTLNRHSTKAEARQPKGPCQLGVDGLPLNHWRTY